MRRLVAATLLVLWSGSAFAQSPESVLLDPGPYFDGTTVRASFRIPQFAATRQLTEAQIDLPGSLELLDVIAADAVPRTSAVDLGCDPTGPPYACGPVVYSNVIAQTVELIDGGGNQSLRFTSSSGNVLNQVELVLRLTAAASCGQITGSYRYNTGPDDPIALPDFGTSCNTAASLTAQPSPPVVVNRGAPAVTLALRADLGSESAPVNRIDALACVDAVGDARACDDAAFLSQNRFRVPLVASFPTRVTVAAIDEPDPPPGALDGALRVTLQASAGPLVSDLPVRVEPLPVSELTLNGPSLLAPGESAQFTVEAARNVLGGNESREVSWSVVLSSLPEDLRAQAASWVSAEGRFTAPDSIGPRQTLNVTLRAAPFNAAPDLDEFITVEVRDARALTCAIVVEESPLGVGARTPLRLEARRTGEEPVELPATFAADRGSIDDGVFTAPSTPGPVRIEATVPACGPVPVLLELEIVNVVAARLSLTEARLAPGQTSVAVIELSSTSTAPLPPLDLAIAIPETVRPGRARADRGTLETRGDENRPRIRWSGGSTRATLRLPLIARAGRSGEGALRLSVHYSDDDLSLAAASSTLRVDRDPELFAATVVGRVFEDRDGDGVLDDDEPGLAGVLVGTSASLYVVSDAHGRFSIPGMSPGRTVIAVDEGSLPFGARLSTARRRVLTLTPGQLHQVRFGVQPTGAEADLPLEAVPLGVDVEGDALVFRVQIRSAGRRIEGIERDANDVAAIPLDPGHALVAVSGPSGLRSFYHLGVSRYPSEGAGEIVTLNGPRLLGSAVLPEEGTTLARSSLLLRPRLQEEETRFEAQAGEARCADPSRCALPIAPAASAIRLVLDAPPDAYGSDPPPLTLTVPISVDPTSHFFVGRAGIEAGLDPRDDWADDWLANGAFFYRGRLGRDVFLTAGAELDVEAVFTKSDGSLRSFGGVARRLLAHDARRIFRDLDPEAYYPTYGDASEAIDERESGGRFFFRLRVDESLVRWGGLNTALDDALVGRYVRSLYGLGGTTKLDGEGGSLEARFFAAQPESAAARDELVVTGSSLYRLRHGAVVEGSVRVTLETLDELSGLAVRATPLVEGIDFEVDYASGRVVMDGALTATAGNPQLTGLGGGVFRRRLLVEYEYLTGGGIDEDWSVGARVDGTLGSTTVGVTAVSEVEGRTSGTDARQSYGLVAATLRAGRSDAFRLRFDIARSEGTSHQGARSNDGGLRFRDGPADEGDGIAAATELSSELGPLSLRAYGRFQQAGYSDSRITPGERRLQLGARANVELGATEGWMILDHLESRRDELQVRNTALLGAARDLGRLSLSTEGRLVHSPRDGEVAAVVGAQAAYRLRERLTLTLRRAQPFNDVRPGESALGAELGRAGEWNGRGEAGVDDDGVPFGRAELGIPLDGQDELYAGLERRAGLRENVLDDRGGDSILLGGRRKLNDGTRLYAEQRLSTDGAERRTQRSVGFDLPRGSMRYFLTYARTALDLDRGTLSETRDGLSTGVVYGGESLRARLSVDARRDGGTVPTVTLGGSGRVDYLPAPGLAFGLGLRGGEDFSEAGDSIARSWEGTAGFAWRTLPDVTWFARVAFDSRSSPPLAEETVESSFTHIAASAVALEVAPKLTLTPKAALRRTRARIEGARLVDRALLTALRADFHVASSWDLAAEGRRCASSGLDANYGVLTEASLLVLRWLRLGAGYNFSDVAAGGVECRAPTARGVFIRAEALY